MPLPDPVPAPPPVPAPCEIVGGAGGASSTPGMSCALEASAWAGITSSCVGSGSFWASFGASNSTGFATGTLTRSLPGNSTFRGGSFI
jgi:hypothetical protein